MRINYVITLTLWSRVTDNNQLEGLHTAAFLYEQLNDAHECVHAIADQINLEIPNDFFAMKRKSPQGTYNSMGWNGGILTLLKLIP